jgi:hypothetical protein
MITLVRNANGRDEKYFKFLEEESEKDRMGLHEE